MRLSRSAFFFLPLAVGLLAASTATAKDKKPKAEPKPAQDAIEIVGHIALPDGPVTRFISTRHYGSHYLYVEHGSGKLLTLIDVTKAAQPSVVSAVAYPSGEGRGSIFAVAGTAALVAEGPAVAERPSLPQTLRIMEFSDPKHPTVVREFSGVTAISRNEQRDLIFVATPDGIWILRQTFALDPEVEKAYAHSVLYNH